MNRRGWVAVALAAGLGAVVVAQEAKKEKPKAIEGFKDTPMQPHGKWRVHDPDRPLPQVVTPGKKFSEMADAPSDATVLFDGKDISKWASVKGGGDVTWKVENGYIETAAKTGAIRTKEEFGDVQLHLEFATPAEVKGRGQGRGNNGVNFLGRYEIQILDSYENYTYADGGAAAIYGQYPPLKNASRPPGEWQTYDILFEAPRWDEAGKLLKKAHVTVIHNGVVVHHRQELWGNTNWKTVGNYNKPHAPKGPIELYEHGNPVRFRNIWVRSLGEYDSEK